MLPDANRYDEIGSGYGLVRCEDSRIRQQIHRRLGNAESVVNVGAGTGSYEPADRSVTAVEPSAEMIAQRKPGLATAVQAHAEELPFDADSFDAAMAVLTVHHWSDMRRGLDEMIRVARRRLVIVAFEPGPLEDLWVVADYFPAIRELKRRPGADSREIAGMLPGCEIAPIPVPRDCSDLFFAALWGHPEMFLDDGVVSPMWVWQTMSDVAREAGRERLANELTSGEWDRKYGDLRDLDELDVGLRLLCLELPVAG